MMNDIKLLNFIDLTERQKLLVLSWRNNRNIRKWMHASESISKEDHFDYIDILKTSETKKYFLVSNAEKYIGIISFTDINKDDSHFGLYSNPDLRVAGNGRILASVLINYAFKVLKIQTLKLEVVFDNDKAINLYKKYNFKITDEKFVGKKNIICMELKNENW